MTPVAVYHCEDGQAWDAYAASHEGGCNYHRYHWRSVIEKSFGHRTHYLAATDGSRISGILPLTHMKSRMFGNFLVSLPCFNYGGLLCSDRRSETALLEAARSLLAETGAGHVELRHAAERLEGLATRQHKVTMLLGLERDEESQWKALDARVRNQVRKAVKCCLTAAEGHLDLLDGFYGVFCRNMRDLGTPVYGKHFFRNVLETFPDTTRVISVMQGGRAVASGILTWHRGTLEVPWASSIRDVREMCPNNLLYWEAIRFALRQGFEVFDFGRSTPGEGTFQFKKQWGAQPAQLNWQYLLENGAAPPDISPRNPRYRLAVRLWKMLPLNVANALGPHIVRNIP